MLPVTLVMFALSRRFGALADRLGPRLFMGAGPLVAGLPLLYLMRMHRHFSYWTELLPIVLVFWAAGAAFVVQAATNLYDRPR